VNSQPDRKVLLDRYELGEIIGVGGMGEVRAAQDLTLDRPVAIKFLRPHLGPTAEIRARFDTEAKAAARLNHPNIVGVFDSGDDEGVPFIVMERLSGRTLADRIAEGPFNEWEARRIGLEVLSALEASHEEGILHRDLKPGNVMLTEKGVAKVVDFGIAKAVEGLDLTDSGLTLGTPGYLAPERIAGDPATPATDVYSVGVILYEMLTGKKPYEADTPVGLLRALQEGEPEPLERARPDLHPTFAAIIERALAKEPRRRYPTAASMRQALEEWLPWSEAAETTSLRSPTSGLLVGKKGSSPARRRAAGVFIAILAIAWPAYIMMNIGRNGPNGAMPSQSPSPSVQPSPTVAVDPLFQAALAELEAAIAQTGTAEDLGPAATKVREAAETGDRLGVSEQLVFMRNQVEALRQTGELPEPSGERLLAAIFGVDLQLGKVVPPTPLSPAPSPSTLLPF
jgi:serine/threonine protein kinase